MKRLLVLTILFVLVLILVVWSAENFKQYTIYNNSAYAWQDAEKKYTVADSVAFDGSGEDDVILGTEDVYAGTADSVVVIKLIAKGAADSTTADTVAWGIASGTDTTSIALTDTTIIADATDSILIAATTYAIFNDSVGHTEDDAWVVQLYGNDADTLCSVNVNNDTLPIRIDAEKIYLYYRAIAAAASDSTDSIIFRAYTRPAPYRQFYQVWGDTIADADTSSGGILCDSNCITIYIDSLHFGPEWKTEWEVRGEEQDSNLYDLLTIIRGLDD